MAEQPHDPRFLPYFGCHHKRIPQPDGYWGGGVSFATHVGKPLTAALWRDLVETCGVDSLWVIRPGDGEWCLGRGSGSCTVYLDEQDLVKDIWLAPYRPCQRQHVTTPSKRVRTQ